MSNLNSNHTPETSRVANAGESRRSFLKRGATLAAAAGSTTLLKQPVYGQSQAPSANVIGANERIVLGLIGTGKQGNNHIKMIHSIQDEQNVTIGAVCDLYQKHLDAAVKVTNLTARDGYQRHEDLLERKDIDAVVICAVDNWHGPISLDAMDAGKHTYCEKPMTRYVEETWDVLDKVNDTGLVYTCGSQYTADAVYHTAARWIQEGKLGPLVWAQGAYCRNNKNNSEWTFPIDKDANPDNLDWKRWLGGAPKIPWDPNRYFSWHKYYDYNSGLLGNLLSHRFLPLMMATGNPEWPERVCCTGTRKISTDREINDTTHVLAEFPSGLTYAIVGSTVNEIGIPDMIRGRQGTLTFSGNRLTLKPERIFSDEIDPEDFQDANRIGWSGNLHKNFYKCIREGGTPYCSADLSAKANTVLCLAEMSERMGLALFFDPETRKITTGKQKGKKVKPLTHGMLKPEPAILAG